MQVFMDSANVKAIQDAVEHGLIDGVTTNPSLIAKEGRNFREVVEEICRIVPGPVSVEVVGTTYDAMMAEGREVAKIADNVVVKIPMLKEGLRAVRDLSQDGIRNQCHPRLLGGTGPPGGQGRGNLCKPLYWAPRRPRPCRHGYRSRYRNYL